MLCEILFSVNKSDVTGFTDVFAERIISSLIQYFGDGLAYQYLCFQLKLYLYLRELNGQ